MAIINVQEIPPSTHELSDSKTEWCERITLNQVHNYTSTCTSTTSHYMNCVFHTTTAASSTWSIACMFMYVINANQTVSSSQIQCIYINLKNMCTLRGHSPEREGQNGRSRWCQHLHHQVGERESRANTLRRWPQSFHTLRMKCWLDLSQDCKNSTCKSSRHSEQLHLY